MAAEEGIEPELPPSSTSEIAATLDLASIGLDGVSRPVLINQDDQDFLALTYEDARRLHKFLGLAVEYLKEYKTRITQ